MLRGGSVDLRFINFYLDSSLHCQTTDAGLVHRAEYLSTHQLSLTLNAPTHGKMARLS